MKMSAALFFLFSAAAFGQTQTPVIIYPAVTSATVVSPLTNSTSQSNQALLSQINATISQRRFEHQILTLTTPTTPTLITTAPQIIRAK